MEPIKSPREPDAIDWFFSHMRPEPLILAAGSTPPPPPPPPSSPEPDEPEFVPLRPRVPRPYAPAPAAALLPLMVLVVLVGGCLDWGGVYQPTKPPPPNPVVVTAIQKKLAHALPVWNVYRAADKVIAAPENGVLPKGAKYIAFPADNADGEYDRLLREGSASLVDYLAIAGTITNAGDRLPRWTEPPADKNPGIPLPGIPLPGISVPGIPGRPGAVTPSASEEEEDTTRRRPKASALARKVREKLVAYIEEHTNADACHVTCEGANSVCKQSGQRSFARGIPCKLGDEDVPTTWIKSYGYAWCASGFCQAMSNLVADED